MFYGKGAGRYPTANAIVNDIIMYKENDNSYSFKNENKLEVKENNELSKYYLRYNNEADINSEIVEFKNNNKVITKEISRNEFKELLSKLSFYAKVI